jgi:hypothetical protein
VQKEIDSLAAKNTVFQSHRAATTMPAGVPAVVCDKIRSLVTTVDKLTSGPARPADSKCLQRLKANLEERAQAMATEAAYLGVQKVINGSRVTARLTKVLGSAVDSLVLSGGARATLCHLSDLNVDASFATADDRKGAYDAVRTMARCVDCNTPDMLEIDPDEPPHNPLLTAMVANLAERADAVKSRRPRPKKPDAGWGVAGRSGEVRQCRRLIEALNNRAEVLKQRAEAGTPGPAVKHIDSGVLQKRLVVHLCTAIDEASEPATGDMTLRLMDTLMYAKAKKREPSVASGVLSDLVALPSTRKKLDTKVSELQQKQLVLEQSLAKVGEEMKEEQQRRLQRKQQQQQQQQQQQAAAAAAAAAATKEQQQRQATTPRGTSIPRAPPAAVVMAAGETIKLGTKSSIRIKAASDFSLPIPGSMLPAGSKVNWSFTIDPDGTDAVFSVKAARSGKVLVESGSFVGESSDSFTIPEGLQNQDLTCLWDNSHSWLTPKELHYDIEIVHPLEQLESPAPTPAPVSALAPAPAPTPALVVGQEEEEADLGTMEKARKAAIEAELEVVGAEIMKLISVGCAQMGNVVRVVEKLDDELSTLIPDRGFVLVCSDKPLAKGTVRGLTNMMDYVAKLEGQTGKNKMATAIDSTALSRRAMENLYNRASQLRGDIKSVKKGEEPPRSASVLPNYDSGDKLAKRLMSNLAGRVEGLKEHPVAQRISAKASIGAKKRMESKRAALKAKNKARLNALAAKPNPPAPNLTRTVVLMHDMVEELDQELTSLVPDRDFVLVGSEKPAKKGTVRGVANMLNYVEKLEVQTGVVKAKVEKSASEKEKEQARVLTNLYDRASQLRGDIKSVKKGGVPPPSAEHSYDSGDKLQKRVLASLTFRAEKLKEHPAAQRIKARANFCADKRMASKLMVIKEKNGKKAREILAKKSRAAVASSNQIMSRLKRVLESSGNSRSATAASALVKSVSSLVQPLMLRKMVRNSGSEWEVAQGLNGLTIPLRGNTALVLGRYDKGWALLRAKAGVTVFNTGIGDEESSMSRTQATLHLQPDLTVRVTAVSRRGLGLVLERVLLDLIFVA